MTSITTETARVTCVLDKYVHIRYGTEIEYVSFDQVKETLVAARKLSDQTYGDLLVVNAVGMMIDQDSREFITTQVAGWRNVAVVVQSLAQRLLLRVLTSAAGDGEIKLFTNEEDAEQWLTEKAMHNSYQP